MPENSFPLPVDKNTTDEEYTQTLLWRRKGLQSLSDTLDSIDGDGGFQSSKDPDFWQSIDRIEAAGMQRNTAEVPWLASLTQVDDLGPMGRAMFLAFAALDALRRMPEATFSEARNYYATLSPDDSIYRKTGVGKLLEASQTTEAIPFLENLMEDTSSYVRQEAQWSLERLRGVDALAPGLVR